MSMMIEKIAFKVTEVHEEDSVIRIQVQHY